MYAKPTAAVLSKMVVLGLSWALCAYLKAFSISTHEFIQRFEKQLRIRRAHI